MASHGGMRVAKFKKGGRLASRLNLDSDESREIVRETVILRQENFSYFIDVHDGIRPWMNLVSIKKSDLRTMYADKKHAKRCESYFYLAYSLGALEAMQCGAQYVCSVSQLITEFVYCLTQTSAQRVKEGKFRARAVVNVDVFQPEVKFLGSVPDYEYLLTPPINVSVDYREVLMVLCSGIARMYAKVLACMKRMPHSVYPHIVNFDCQILGNVIDPMVRDIEDVASKIIKRVYKAIRPSKLQTRGPTGHYSEDDDDDGDDDDGSFAADLWGTGDDMELDLDDDMVIDDATYSLDEYGYVDREEITEDIISELRALDRGQLQAVADQKSCEIEEFEMLKEELADLSKEIGKVHIYCDAQGKVAELFVVQMEKAAVLDEVAHTADAKDKDLIRKNREFLEIRIQETGRKQQECARELSDLTARIGYLQEQIKAQQLAVSLAIQTRGIIEEMLVLELDEADDNDNVSLTSQSSTASADLTA